MLTNKQLQSNLNFLGFNCGKIDGIIGFRTKSAIKNFRKSFELTIVNYWNEEADKKCIDLVKDIQKKIGAVPDGIAGTETISKTKIYQKSVGLVPDGIAGVQTRAKLNQTASYTWFDFPHFRKQEFSCKCGCGFDNINLKVVKILEEIRAHFDGKPVYVTSGCRCEKHNKKVGGIKGSKHLEGLACDFYIKGVSTQDLLNYCISLMNKRHIKYTYTNNKNMKGVVHINL